MKFIKLAILTVLISVLAGCSAGNDSNLVGIWETDSSFSPISVVTFNGKTCSMKAAIIESITQLQYKTDTKEGTISYYNMKDKIATAKPISTQKYTVAGLSLQFDNSLIVFQKKQ